MLWAALSERALQPARVIIIHTVTLMTRSSGAVTDARLRWSELRRRPCGALSRTGVQLGWKTAVGGARACATHMTSGELRQRAAAGSDQNVEPGSVDIGSARRPADATSTSHGAVQDDDAIRERAAAALAAHNAARAAPKPASCVRRLLGLVWIAVCAFFSYNVLMNGVEQPFFSSPSLSVYGHQFFRLTVCSVTRAPLDRWTAPHKDTNEYARRLRAAFATACPKREVDAFEVGLDKFGTQRARIVRWAGIVFCVAAPLFCFFSSASVPAALALLTIRIALRGATLNAGFVALLSYTGLHAFFLLWNRFKGDT